MAQLPVQAARAPANAAAASDRGMAHATAVHLAEAINLYWAELGYDAEARVVEIRILDGRGNADEFGVVSNLRNGIPARRLSETNRKVFAPPPSRS